MLWTEDTIRRRPAQPTCRTDGLFWVYSSERSHGIIIMIFASPICSGREASPTHSGFVLLHRVLLSTVSFFSLSIRRPQVSFVVSGSVRPSRALARPAPRLSCRRRDIRKVDYLITAPRPLGHSRLPGLVKMPFSCGRPVPRELPFYSLNAPVRYAPVCDLLSGSVRTLVSGGLRCYHDVVSSKSWSPSL